MGVTETASDIHDVWATYWEQYYADERMAMETVAREYPVRRGLEVSYRDLLDLGMPHRQFRYEPAEVLGAGIEEFGAFVHGSDIEDAWDREFSAMILHVTELPSGFKVNRARHLGDHLGELVQLEATVSTEPESRTDLMEAAFVCPDGHVTRVHQGHMQRQFIDTCGRRDCQQSVWLDPDESLYSRIQRARFSGEHFTDVLAVLGGNDSRQADMAVGDEYVLNALPRPDIRGETTHGDVYLGVLTVEPAAEGVI